MTNLVERVCHSIIGRPVIAALIAVLSLAIGGVLAVWPGDISNATRHWVNGPRDSGVAWWVVGFWVVVALWTIVLYFHLREDDRKEGSRVAELTAAIYRAPNYQAIFGYRETFRQIALNLATIPDSESEADVADRIRAALVIIAALARTFRGAPDSVRYGANVMLVVRPDKNRHECYAPEVLSALRFVDRTSTNFCSLRGILYLPPALLHHSSVQDDETRVPVIALPVPHAAVDEWGHALALPGAPWALLEGNASVFENARIMADRCADLSAPIRQEVAKYFSDAGDGRMLGSLASFRIGDERTPVGILNIDCSETDILGKTLDYYPTFYALMAPILHLLAEPVNRYARLAGW